MPLGYMVWWRFKREVPGPWHFGYTSSVGQGLIRLGRWNGDTMGGYVVSPSEVEWKPHA